MSPTRLTLTTWLDDLRPGAQVYIPGASGELASLRQALQDDPERLDGVTLTSCLVPGMNSLDYAALHAGVGLNTFLLPPPLRASFESGRVQVRPLAYSAIARYLAAAAFDVAFLNLTPAQNGVCGFGACADFGPIVARTAKRRIGVLNTALPRPVSTPGLALDDLDGVIEVHDPMGAAAVAAPSPDMQALAQRVVALVPDGAAIQTGIGSAPAAVWSALQQHRGLRLYSGMVTNGFLDALEAGAMAQDGHVAGVAFGDAALYAALDRSSRVRFADVHATHGPGLDGVEGLVAINSALEVDLLGQANLEWLNGRLVSGVGGAPDFTRAAQLSPGGRSILALPATARGGGLSRIVPRLTSPGVSIPRNAIDTVVTEYGAADLKALSMDQRAAALIAIAAPQHREALDRAWREQQL